MDISKLYAEYTKTPKFVQLSPSSKKAYRKAIKYIAAHITKDINNIERRDIIDMRDAMVDKPGMANMCLAVASILLRYAVDKGIIYDTPFNRINKLRLGHHNAWPKKDLAKIPYLPERSRRVALVCLHTAQRFSDVAWMRWSDIKGDLEYDGYIEITQQKTGKTVCIPISMELRQHLLEWDQQPHLPNELICYMKDTVKTETLREMTRRELRRVGIKGTLHGLRATSLTRFAEAGCSPHEIMAISGHGSLSTVMPYTKSVNQKAMARIAVGKLNNHMST